MNLALSKFSINRSELLSEKNNPSPNIELSLLPVTPVPRTVPGMNGC